MRLLGDLSPHIVPRRGVARKGGRGVLPKPKPDPELEGLLEGGGVSPTPTKGSSRGIRSPNSWGCGVRSSPQDQPKLRPEPTGGFSEREAHTEASVLPLFTWPPAAEK